MAHVTTNQYGNGYTQIGGGLATCTNSVNTGSGSNRAVLVTHMRRTDRSPVVQSVTLGGENMTILGADQQLNGLYYCRTFALVNPTVTGFQDLVITTTTSGSSSVGDTLVSVYDNVDPNATAANLLVIDDSQSILTPWNGSVSIDIPSSVGHQVVATLYSMSNDVSYTIFEVGTTERHNTVVGGIGKYSGDADGAASVTASWSASVLSADAGWALFGFSLPPPSAGGLFGVRQCANGQLQASGFYEIADLYPSMRIGSNVTVQMHEMVEEAGRTTHQINSSGVYRCGEFKEI